MGEPEYLPHERIVVAGEVFYSAKGTSKLLGMSQKTVGNYLKSGRLSGRRVGRRTMIPETAVLKLIRGPQPD